MQIRPEYPTIDYGHPLADGLVFAGLAPARFTNGAHYHDSSLHNKHGTLTNMEPETDWAWNSTLNRFMLSFGGTNEYVALPPLTSSTTHTISFWINPLTVGYPFDVGTGRYLITFGMGVAEPNIAVYDGSLRYVGTYSLGTLTHYTFVADASISQISCYKNGSLTGNAEYTPHPLGGLIKIATRYDATSGTITADMSDILIHSRPLSLPEIKQVANPSNTMLSGLILPPPRKLWAVVSGAGPTYNIPAIVHHRRMTGAA